VVFVVHAARGARGSLVGLVLFPLISGPIMYLLERASTRVAAQRALALPSAAPVVARGVLSGRQRLILAVFMVGVSAAAALTQSFAVGVVTAVAVWLALKARWVRRWQAAHGVELFRPARYMPMRGFYVRGGASGAASD
jgi:hypothetical protein